MYVRERERDGDHLIVDLINYGNGGECVVGTMMFRINEVMVKYETRHTAMSWFREFGPLGPLVNNLTVVKLEYNLV